MSEAVELEHPCCIKPCSVSKHLQTPLMCSDRRIKLEKRKEKLGEKSTSDWTWRKFSTERLTALNPTRDFDTVDNIYEIGWCNGNDKMFGILTEYIAKDEVHKIQELNSTIQYGQDPFGTVPIGKYLKTFIWTLKDTQSFVQIISGSFDTADENIVFEQNIPKFDIETLTERKLIYPVD